MSDFMQMLEQYIKSDYKYGFISNIEMDKLFKGLSEDVVCVIFVKKNELEWLIEWCFKVYC